MKKSLALVFTFALAGLGMGQDASSSPETLENADFSDGTNHWHGDIQPAGSDRTTDFVTHPLSATGGVVNLRSHNWTCVTQRIHRYKGNWKSGTVLTITYQTSPDFKFAKDATINDSDDERIPGLKQLMGDGDAAFQGNSNGGSVVAFVDVPPESRTTTGPTRGNVTTVYVNSDAISSVAIKPETVSQPQTFTSKMTLPPPTENSEPFFCIAIPPGSGSITITKISITAKQ